VEEVMPRRTRAAFTLIEVLTVLLVLTLGVGSVLGVLSMANRYTAKAIGRFSGLSTATTLLYDHAPLGLTPDANDADNDGWSGDGAFSWNSDYTLRSRGYLNGYWCVREETSTAADLVAPGRRWAWVTVDVYFGVGGAHITRQQERILRARTP
jgi:hypothetical protein